MMKMRELIYMWFSAFKIFALPIPSRPATQGFVTTRPDPVPKSKATTRQALPSSHCQT